MARQIERLSALKVSKVKAKGLYPDGGNLYLQVTEAGSKSWIFRYMINGTARTMGLGSLNAISLADARAKAVDCRKSLAEGVDPLEARKTERLRSQNERDNQKTFRFCAEKYIEAHKSGWRNAKHATQWTNTLTEYAFPLLGDRPVQEIDSHLIMDVLEPIWPVKTETAVRLRRRIEAILDWAGTKQYRTGDNPARWRGHLQNLLSKPSLIQKTKHHPALAYTDISTFINELHEHNGSAALALELVILTASRTSEVICASWKEFDLKNKIWTVPADRIKSGREHRVPLSDPAVKILKKLHVIKTGDYIFPGKKDKPLSNMAMLALLKRMKRDDITVHGFRSSFRDWAAEQTNYPREVAEQALSHIIDNKTEAAYRRGDLLEKRALLMSAWAKYCYQPKSKGKVLKIRG